MGPDSKYSRDSQEHYTIICPLISLKINTGRALGEGNGNPLRYSCLENPMTEKPGRLHGVAKSWT